MGRYDRRAGLAVAGMIPALLASKAAPWLIAGAVAAAGIWYGRDADKALDREQGRAVAAELQRDQARADAANLRKQLAEKAALVAEFAKLPEARLRLCVVQGPSSGCCKPEPSPCMP